MIKEVEVMGFIRNMAGREHAGFIYHGKATKDAVLSQFFDPSASLGTQKALIFLHEADGSPDKKLVQRIAYNEFLKVEKSEAMDKMFNWIGRYTSQTGPEGRRGSPEKTPPGF